MGVFIYATHITQAPSRDPSIFGQLMDELLALQQSFVQIGASTLYEFSNIHNFELGDAAKCVAMQAVHASTGCPAFQQVQMPDEIFESAFNVLLESRMDDPSKLLPYAIFPSAEPPTSDEAPVMNSSCSSAAPSRHFGPGYGHDLHISATTKNREDFRKLFPDTRKRSIVCGMGFRRELMKCLTSLFATGALESVTLVSRIPLAFRDDARILNMDDAREFRSELGNLLPNIRQFLLKEAEDSDKALHDAIQIVAEQKLQLCFEGAMPVTDLLDFAKAFQSVVCLVSDSSSSKFLRLCFERSNERLSVLNYCLSLAQFCVNKAASDATNGMNHAAAAFLFMSIAISIVENQKTGPLSKAQISKNLHNSKHAALGRLSDTAFKHLSDVGKFHEALLAIDASTSCRFVATWLLQGDGQFFHLFREREGVLSCLVPLNEGKLLQRCVAFIHREVFQQYVPAACFSWLSREPAFSQQFLEIFSNQNGFDFKERIPQFISPFSPPFCPKDGFGGQLVASLFGSDEAQQKASASIISSIICSNPDVNIDLIGPVLHRIKSGSSASGCRSAIEMLLTVMEHPGLQGSKTSQGGIQGGWHSRDEFFMTLLHGRSHSAVDKTTFLQELSVEYLLHTFKAPHPGVDSSAQVSLINAVFTNLILISRGISKSQSMWRLENPDKQGMLDMFFKDSKDGVFEKIMHVFRVLNQFYESVNVPSGLLFSLTEMIQIATSLLCSTNFALRRPLLDVQTFFSCCMPLIARVEPSAADDVARAIVSAISPEFYVACINNARCFRNFYFAKGFVDADTHDLVVRMRQVISNCFCSTVSALHQVSRANPVVVNRIIFHYFDYFQSLFTFFGETTLISTRTVVQSQGKLAKDAQTNMEKTRRPAVFLCEVWPKPVQMSAKFSIHDVGDVLDVVSSENDFKKFWASATAIQEALDPNDALATRLSLMRPMHKFAAHAVNFSAEKLIAGSYAALFHPTDRSAAYAKLDCLCNIILPLDSFVLPPSVFQEEIWLMALPVVREIALQQTSYLSSATSMFMGVPALVDGHLFAATHIPWVLGNIKDQARFVCSGSYDDHQLFVGGGPVHENTAMFSFQLVRSAALSLFTNMALDFFGKRSAFFVWMRHVVSCDTNELAVHGDPFHTIPSEQLGTLSKYFENARKDLTKRRIRQSNQLFQAIECDPRIQNILKTVGWRVELQLNEQTGQKENYYVYSGSDQGLIVACALLTRRIGQSVAGGSSQLSLQLYGEIASDTLALLPVLQHGNSKHPPSVWDKMQLSGHLEHQLFFERDILGKDLFNTSINTSCQYTFAIFSDPDLRQCLTPDKIEIASNSVRHTQQALKAVSDQKHISDTIQSLANLLHSCDGHPPLPLPAQARSQITGSFFRICAASLNSQQSMYDSELLVVLCKNFCRWFSGANLVSNDALDRSIDVNTFSGVFTIGLETVRAAIHCLMQLPNSKHNLSELLQFLLPILTENHQDLIDVVVSTITKPSNFPPVARASMAVQVHPLLSSILTTDGVQKTPAFQVAVGRPSLFLKICNWLMINHNDAQCGYLLLSLVSEQTFPKVIDISLPRANMTGLINAGNTCFISSLYQQLASLPQFVSGLQSVAFGPEGKWLVQNQQSKAVVLKELLGKISNQQQPLSKDVVTAYLQKLGFAPPYTAEQQDDPMAVLRKLITSITVETSDYDRHRHGDETHMKQTAFDSPFLRRTVVSEMRGFITWPDCVCSMNFGEMVDFFEDLNTLKEDRTHSTGCQSMKSIEEVLSAHLIDRANEQQCNCRPGQSPCKITLEFEKLPDVLVLGLNSRLSYAGSRLSVVKDYRVPSIPSELDMRKCAKLSSSAASGNTIYSLNGIILHHGDENGGHYTSLLRRADSSWVHIDDGVSYAVDEHHMHDILNREGRDLPYQNYTAPNHLSGKPTGLFYALKSVSHPCSSVLFDPRLVTSLETTASCNLPSPFVARDALSLCFKLAALFAHEKDRLQAVATVAQKFLTHPESLSYFHQLLSSQDPELVVAICKFRIPAFESHGDEEVFFKSLAMKMADDAPHVSSRAVHRRVSAGFEIACKLAAGHHQEICDKFCSMIANLVEAGPCVGAEEGAFPAKAYAALKSISDLPDHSPFLSVLSHNEHFVRSVAAMHSSLSIATADQKTNLYASHLYFFCMNVC